MFPPPLFTRKFWPVVLWVVLVILIAMACSFSLDMGGEPTPNLVATQNSLLSTQMALDATQQAQQQAPVDAESQAPPPEEPAAEIPQEAVEEPTAPPEPVASDTPIPDVLYQDIAFSFDHSIAAGVTAQSFPAQNLGEDAFPGDNHPAYDEFDFYTYALPETFHSPAIYVYPAGEYAAMDQVAAETIAHLGQVLSSRPSEQPADDMPFLPRWNAAQFMASNIRYLDFHNGSGVRYLTMYGQATWPINNQDIFYTFQGLTNDGAYYIAAVLPVSNPILPNEGSIPDDDYLAFEENFESYLADTVNQLNAQPDESFTPNLALLDAMMQSFSVRE